MKHIADYSDKRILIYDSLSLVLLRSLKVHEIDIKKTYLPSAAIHLNIISNNLISLSLVFLNKDSISVCIWHFENQKKRNHHKKQDIIQKGNSVVAGHYHEALQPSQRRRYNMQSDIRREMEADRDERNTDSHLASVYGLSGMTEEEQLSLAIEESLSIISRQNNYYIEASTDENEEFRSEYEYD